MKWLTELRAQRPDLTVVGEVKPFSPFGYSNSRSLNRVTLLALLDACPEIDIISIHTNRAWGGDFDWLEEARGLTKKPILAKGFHDTIWDVREAFSRGANHCLTVGWWPGDSRCWHEPSSVVDLLGSEAEVVVWNSRNPRTGEKRPEAWVTVRSFRPTGRICQASNIRCASGVHPDAQAVLIGEGLFL